MVRSYKYKLRMNKAFFESCQRTLDCCRDLYNAALSQRVTRFKQGRIISFAEQCRQLTEAREIPEVGAVLRGFQSNTLKRLHRAYAAFFRRLKSKEGKAGFPRFKGYERYDSFNTMDTREFRLEGDKLTVQKLGSCRVRLSRPLAGTPRTLTIKREFDGWYVIIGCDGVEPSPLPKSNIAIGVDVGLTNFATLSNGEEINNPRYFRSGESGLARAQRRLALKRKGSESRKRAKRAAAKSHAKIQRQRDWFHWQQARALVSRFDLIAVENLNVKGLAKSNLAKSIYDVGWASFINKLACKAEEAGRKLVKVTARFTSQDCSRCGKRQKLDLSERWYSCPCGAELSRDHNAAINILGRAVPDLKIKSICEG